MRVPNRDHYCECKEGVMRWVTKKGYLIIRRYESDPFKKNIVTDAKTQDDRDWDAYIQEKREALNDELYDPLSFNDGTSVKVWDDNARGE